ncbi:MAG TPA: LLM class F420-dependent oxidoreductase [Acidimicrobiales bacterium]|nr:LLM class F420-dependent oxidoreductase [Acidimicrobiales bacterium]
MLARLFVEPQMGASYEDQLRVARAAEESGFDALFRSDHYLTMGGEGLPGPTDSWVTLAALARETSRIRLGTLVTAATFRLPGPLAIIVAQVDAMSGGRVELGIGAGWYDQEHSAYGIPFPPFGERFARLEEQLEILTGLWTTAEGDQFSFEGRHYRLEKSPALPKPFQRPHPPIIVGGLGPKTTPRLAARFASEYNTPFMSPADAENQFKIVREACEAAQRDPADITFSSAVVVCCGSDQAEFARRAAAIGREEDELRRNGAAGLVDDVVERLLEYRDAGASRVYLQFLDLSDIDQVRLLGSDVLPLIA